ncbi:MAG: sensor domain-containing diguanylate cyclase [Treponema sp.]|nr:sensor domain-containing diguanylate cyclase [Treponema sp.]
MTFMYDSVVETEETEDLLRKYKDEIDDLNSLMTISCSLCSTLDYSVLMESMLYTFMYQAKILGVALFVLDTLDADVYKLGMNYSGMELDHDIDYVIPENSPIVQLLLQNKTVMTIEELRKCLPDCPDVTVLESLKPTLIVPFLLKNNLNGILLLGDRIGGIDIPSCYSAKEKKYLKTLATFCAVSLNNVALVDRASTDMMTHLRSKYFFFSRLNDELNLAVAQNMKLSVIMYDIDYFKSVNDRYGHSCGDFVLTTVAEIILANIRSKDLACRYGGEEITVMLYNTDLSEAVLVAERIRKRIEEYDFFYKNQHISVTISGGVSVFDVEKTGVLTGKQLVDYADAALYRSKTKGRNCIEYTE